MTSGKAYYWWQYKERETAMSPLMNIISSLVFGTLLVVASIMLMVKWGVMEEGIKDIPALAMAQPATAVALVVFIGFLGFGVNCLLTRFPKQ